MEKDVLDNPLQVTGQDLVTVIVIILAEQI
jgi:hypothetical protein